MISQRADWPEARRTTPPDGADPLTIDQVLEHYRPLIGEALLAALTRARARAGGAAAAAAQLLDEFYGQMEYHHGWRDTDLAPMAYHPGKLLRPTLVLLACELAASQRGLSASRRAAVVRTALPAAVAVELVHNFSLVHDDIEDSDEVRHHRPTLWRRWGVPQAINTGDGLFALAHMQLWQLAEHGVSPRIVLRQAELLDRTCLELCEGQFLDMRFEGQRTVSVAMYLDMIGRKTAALMGCAGAMGGMLGAPADSDISARLGEFGHALGVAFQLRDDLLGIWAAEDLGKSYAGDLRRKKMSLPVITALEHATEPERQALAALYAARGPATEAQIAQILAILEHTDARTQVRRVLRHQCDAARAALESAARAVPDSHAALRALNALLDYVASEAGPRT